MEPQRRVLVLTVLTAALLATAAVAEEAAAIPKRHAYAAMMYMGTPRDYEFYVATRVMMRSLAQLRVDADLVVIASLDVPIGWVETLWRKRQDVRRVRMKLLKFIWWKKIPTRNGRKTLLKFFRQMKEEAEARFNSN